MSRTLRELRRIPVTSPERIFSLRESAFAQDLFITAVSHLDFFNRLDKSPSDIDTICEKLEIQKRPADVMLTLFKAYGFVKEKRKTFYLSDTSRDYLVGRSGFDLSSYVSSLKDRPICTEMLKVVRTGRPANWAASKTGKEWAAAMEEDSFAETFSAGMNSRGAYLVGGLVKVVDFSRYHKILDIGGASGIYSAIILDNNPNLRATVFEKPPVDKVARYAISKFGLNDRMSVKAGDMFKDSLPGGYDLHLLSHVLHDWDIEEVKTALKNSYSNLESGGKIMIHDAHINRRKTGPVPVAEYSVLLMFLSEGKCYSITEMEGLLQGAGFTDITYRRTVLNRSVITGKKL